MQDTLPQSNYRAQTPPKALFWIVLALTMAGLFAAGLGNWEEHKRRAQMQNDPRVARAWIAGVTFGKTHTLKRGATLQQWLNAHNITFLGTYEVLQSQFNGDPGGVELWFNYESYLIGQPDLECHRINPIGTAFTDDLGQPYHGFLDMHGKTIGVYLPGYDHAAKRLTCALHWVPRQPAPPFPVSNAMVFTIDLPPARRILPAASTLPRGPITLAKEGITVTAGAARLSPPKLGSAATGQRDLTFRLKIEGGHLANDNVSGDISEADTLQSDLSALSPKTLAAARTAALLRLKLSRQLQINQSLILKGGVKPTIQFLPAATFSTGDTPLTITDPYGVSLVVPQQSVTPLITKETVQSARSGGGTVWVAPVNDAGHGTDVIKLHFDVAPTHYGKGGIPAPSVPFDLLLPLQTGDEI